MSSIRRHSLDAVKHSSFCLVLRRFDGLHAIFDSPGKSFEVVTSFSQLLD
jgi:hypothetical protein